MTSLPGGADGGTSSVSARRCGPWNLVWRDGLPVAVIDFDDVDRGAPADDVGYALRMFVGCGYAEAEPAELARRTGAALAAYGADFDVPALLERAWLAANRHLLQTATSGV